MPAALIDRNRRLPANRTIERKLSAVPSSLPIPRAVALALNASAHAAGRAMHPSAARRWRSLRLYLSAAFILCALVPLALLSALQLRQIEAAARQADAHQAQMTDNLARDVAAHVAMHQRALEAAAHQVTVAGDLYPPRLTSILRGLRAGLPGFINLYFADARGVTLAFEPPLNAAGQSMVGVDFSDRWHYRAVIERRRTVMSPVIKGRGGTDKLLITIVVPYFAADGSFLGFVLGALDLDRVGALVAARRLDGRSYAVITDAHGGAIHHPRFDPDATPQDLSEEAVLSQAATQRRGALTHASHLSDEPVFSTFTRLDHPDWLLWISRPLVERDAARRDAVASAGWMLVSALLGSALLAWIFAARTGRAVGDLMARMQRLREGSRVTPADATRGPYEFAQLAHGLDDMAAALASHRQALIEANATLEQRVRTRTERLRRRQRQIAALYRQSAAQRSTLQAVFEGMSEALVLVDRDGRLAYANRSFARLLGRPAEPLMGQPVEAALVTQAGDVFGPDALALLRQLIAGDLSQAVLAARGRYFAVTMFDVTSGRDALGRGGLVRDITGAREIEQMKDSLIGMAAHEFKTPVTALRMRVESLLRVDAHWSADFRDELLRGMLEDVGRLQMLVTDWLDVARIESGGLRLTLDAVPVQRLLKAAVDAVRPQGEFDLRIEVATELTARLDAQRMQQVLINLLSNAIRYCNERPRIGLRAWRDASGWLLIEVQDNGIGIHAEDQARIFDRFFQVARGHTRRPGGTGLGLAIARGIVIAHGGSVDLHSAPGEGSVFTLRLPPAPAPAAQEQS